MEAGLAKLSFNQITSGHATLQQAVEACNAAGIGWIAPWRHKLAAGDVRRDARLIREAGLRVSSLCRGGLFPAATAEERRERIADNLVALEQAAGLGAGVLVLVCGAAPDRDLDGARRMVEDAIAELAPEAKRLGVKLGIEPLHPMFAADRSVIVTLGEANGIARQFGDEVGVVIDAYHVWWDPELYAEIERARGRIVGFHVSDWIVPLPDILMGRGMMGDGCIELRRIRQAVEAAGYDGAIEVEIFNESIWNAPPVETAARVRQRYEEFV